jgi:hypothetical protein
LQCPKTNVEWINIAEEFNTLWNLPNCIGAIDGKHITIRQPACSGAKFFNYKHSFSIILLALVDAQYKFLFIDIGAQGRCSDAGVFSECQLLSAIERNTLGLPENKPLPKAKEPFPFFIIGDDAFPLKNWLLKPYPHRNLNHQQRIYNYRISRARRCVENAFGIMASRFRVLLSAMCLQPKNVDNVVLACCSMHNMLRTLSPKHYVRPASEVDVTPNQNIIPSARVLSRRSATQRAKHYRNYLCEYVNSPEGSVSWQERYV